MKNNIITHTLSSVIQNYGDNTAIVSSVDSLTYRELNANAKVIANNLSAMGIGRGCVVALFSDRSSVTITGMLATLLCGGAYTIVEDDDNLEENSYRFLSINPDLVVCDKKYTLLLRNKGLNAVSFQELSCFDKQNNIATLPLNNEIDENDIAYVLYTSGSTGKPKGVQVSHGNILHYVSSIKEFLQIDQPLNYAHLSTLAADLGNTSLLLSLFTGGCLHLIDGKTRKDPRKLLNYFKEHNIQFLKITPSHWKAIFSSFIESDVELPHLEYLIFGGEALSKKFAKEILHSNITTHFFNHYGPTEATVGVTAFPITSERIIDTIESDSVPIGLPFGDTTLLICDDCGEFHEAKEVTGELYIGGPSVAHGYRDQADITAERFQFIDANKQPSMAFYKTGDLVKVDGKGVLSFLGRIDRQVKINGYRVELEHIESALRTINGVEDAVTVNMAMNGKNFLVAAIVSRDHGESISWLEDETKKILPEYMVPKRFIYMLDFPRNENGKTQVKYVYKEIENILLLEMEKEKSAVKQSMFPDANYYEGESLSLYYLIKPLFQKYLPGKNIGREDLFTHLGGDSLDSIQLIADLQYKNLDISAIDFIENPTIDSVINKVINKKSNGSKVIKHRADKIYNFSAAQDLFFKQGLSQKDHYNQSILFEVNEALDEEKMALAVSMVVKNHELLHTAFVDNEEGVYAKTVNADTISAFSSSYIKSSNEPLSESFNETFNKSLEEILIDKEADALQRSLSLKNAETFKVHLFKTSVNKGYLLLLAHHLCVDVISWRIIVNELTRTYADLKANHKVRTYPVRHSFWDWVDHLDDQSIGDIHQHSINNNSSNNVDVDDEQEELLLSKSVHTEQETQTYWFGYSVKQTQQLKKASEKLNIPIHLILMGAFIHEFANKINRQDVVIDVESHGRVSFDHAVDVSRVVGWHTSTFPLSVHADVKNLMQTLDDTQKAFNQVESLGVSAGLSLKQASDEHINQSVPVCFNFLGDTNFNVDDRVELSPSSLRVGNLRGEENIRHHAIKVSSRMTNGQLFVDVSIANNDTATHSQRLLNLASCFREAVNSFIDSKEHFLPSVVEPYSSTGSIHYAPRSLIQKNQSDSLREYSHVLLTGATGFLGAYCLRELLLNSEATITCLVRKTASASAEKRLQETVSWYFPQEDWGIYSDRINIMQCDLTEPLCGLHNNDYQTLSENIDAVYHFAADTRLMGSEEDFLSTNIAPLKQLLKFSKNKRVKDFHYISTLAVCGVNTAGEQVTFSEEDLDVGQFFQNGYEKSKFKAEQLINEFILEGNPGFIYRTGNVSGHSQSAIFQRNASDNRLIQFLNACAKIGELPQDLGESVCLSPVDIVVGGMVSLSLSAQQKPGVYHVDSRHPVSMKDMFDALKDKGITFQSSKKSNFKDLFNDFDKLNDTDIVLGRFWSSRAPRNVCFDNNKTDRALDRIGLKFHPLSREWLSNFIGHLLNSNAINRPSAEILHLNQFRRKRIFSIPTNSRISSEAS